MSSSPIDNITIIENFKNKEDSPVWSSIYGHTLHPEFKQPSFLRYNNSTINLIDLYHGETCYLIGRGPSVGKFLEDKETKDFLLNPFVMKYTMNTSPQVIDFNCNFWSGVDRMTKFPKQIFKNPSIQKFIPLNRYYQRGYSMTKAKDETETIAFDTKKTANCSNTIGVNCYLLHEDTKKTINFSESFLSNPSVLYGYYKGYKSVLLFSLKVIMLLGFRKIVFVGVDFKMDSQTPYYKETLEKYSKFHVDHNNQLYKFLADEIKNIQVLLQKRTYGYSVEFYSANKIDLMPFIPVIDLKKTLRDEIAFKSKS